jgi:hypothetical protein
LLVLAEQADRNLPVGSLIVDGGATAGWRPEQAVADELLDDAWAWMEAEQAALLSAVRQASSLGPAAESPREAKRLAELAWRLAGAATGFQWLRGCGDDYRRACDLALRGARRAGIGRGAAWMLAALAWVAVDRMRFEEAMALAEQARRLHRQVRDRRGEAYALLKACHANEHRGRLDEAVNQLEGAGRLYDELGDDHGRAWVPHTLGRIHRKQCNCNRAPTTKRHPRSSRHWTSSAASASCTMDKDGCGKPRPAWMRPWSSNENSG